MADSSVAVTAGSGTSIDTRTEGTNGNHRQVVVLGDPATNAGVAPVDATNGLAVDVKQSALPTGAATDAKQDTGNTSLAAINTDTTAINTDTTAIKAAVKTEDAAHASGDKGVMPLAVRNDTRGALAGTDGDYIPLTTNSSGDLRVDGSAVTQPVSAASLPLPSGAATSAKQDTGNTSLASIDGKITAVDTGSVTIASSALPTGAATAAKQDTGNTSLASIATNTGNGATSANQTNGSQLTQVTDGTNAANVLKSDGTAAGQNALKVASAFQEFTGSANSATDLIASTDVSGYRWGVLQITGTWVGTINPQFSNDNSTFVSNNLLAVNTTSGYVAGITANNIYRFPIEGRYLRIRMSSYTSGTANATLELYSLPQTPQNQTNSVAQSGTWTVGSNSATGSAVPANAFFLGIQNSSGNLTGLASGQGDGNGLSSAMSSAGYVYNGTNWDRLRGDSTSGMYVQIRPNTGGGWTVKSLVALSNTKTAVKAAAGTVGGYMFYNPNASVVYIQVYNTAIGSITVGTTTAAYVIPIPATSGANVEFTAGINHSTEINVAATTTATGSTAPGTAVDGFMLYK